MEIINRKQRMFSISRKLRRESKTVGFVATMGSLHDGHVSLVKEARQRSDVVIVSIFVNPKQFNDDGDLQAYPRDLTRDAALLAEYEVDYVFAPEAEEIYPKGFSTYVEVEGLSADFEGASRPGHFRGVSTIVTILLNTIRPDFAFFGQKDAQQLAIIKRLTLDLGFETEIVTVPTLREDSGLAMSSRNQLLSEDDRQKAAIIIQALREAKTAFKKGERNASDLAQIVSKRVEDEPSARLDYVAIVDRESFRPIEKVGENEALIVTAVFIGNIRLIDNVILNRKQ
jgi:pantoate--beta-alanine ligase